MGASSYWSTRNRSAPIPLCPQPIDQINVDLTPFKSPQLKTSIAKFIFGETYVENSRWIYCVRWPGFVCHF